jgi:histidinol-phosphate/aromatic aminotransferase/cobyric acid decarboxylase-like protein
LEAYTIAHGRNEYYEQVLKGITLLDKKVIQAEPLNGESWYEIDDAQDLDIAESIFTVSADEKLKKYQNKYGGYWRYPHLIDFCYLVNPFFPPQKLLDEMKSNFEVLISSYPSGMEINALLAAKQFGLSRDQILVGNGATELIKALMERLSGKFGMVRPTFEEYPNRIDSSNLVAYYPTNEDYAYTAEEMIEFFSDKPISNLLLINPDNPSGNYIKRADILKIAAWSQNKGITFIVDESFVDYIDIEKSGTLLDETTLKAYPNLIVIKSLSKSYGIPGLRLGILASYQRLLIHDLKKDVAIWNINSFAEFYMQIFEKYRNDYDSAIEKFIAVKKDYIEKLTTIKNLRVIPSQANYLLCEITGGYHSKEVTARLLDNDQMLIKDLSTKKGFSHRQYIRIAVKQTHENDRLVEALKQILEDD